MLRLDQGTCQPSFLTPRDRSTSTCTQMRIVINRNKTTHMLFRLAATRRKRHPHFVPQPPLNVLTHVEQATTCLRALMLRQSCAAIRTLSSRSSPPCGCACCCSSCTEALGSPRLHSSRPECEVCMQVIHAVTSRNEVLVMNPQC